MDKLHDVARRLGVETYIAVDYASDNGPCDDVTCADCYCARPRLDIAHECLGKLPMSKHQLELDYGEAGNVWRAWDWRLPEDSSGIYRGDSFEEAVIALAERFLKVGIPLTMQPAFPEQALDTPSGEEG